MGHCQYDREHVNNGDHVEVQQDVSPWSSILAQRHGFFSSHLRVLGSRPQTWEPSRPRHIGDERCRCWCWRCGVRRAGWPADTLVLAGRGIDRGRGRQAATCSHAVDRLTDQNRFRWAAEQHNNCKPSQIALSYRVLASLSGLVLIKKVLEL